MRPRRLAGLALALALAGAFVPAHVDAATVDRLFEPPPELDGKINMLKDVNEVVNAGLRYLGFPRCNSNPDELKQVNELLQIWYLDADYVLVRRSLIDAGLLQRTKDGSRYWRA